MAKQGCRTMNIDKTLPTSGERLRRARILAGLSTRREFEKKYNISANTLQGWEQGKNPLSEKGARRVVEAFKWEGLLCSVEWLMHGTGMPPRPYDILNAGLKESCKNEVFTEQNIREEEAIYKETQLFKEQNVNSILLSVADDSMEPYYFTGDHIGGIQIFDNEIGEVTGNFCIVELENNLIIPRLLQAGNRAGLYNVCCTNPTTQASPLNFYNVRVLSAAPILWHRRKISSMRHL